jgi:hypothetical protein
MLTPKNPAPLVSRVRIQRSDGRARPLSRRRRQTLVRWLRRTAKRAARTDPVDRRRETLLCDRVSSVRERLLDIAWLLERGTDPDPRSVAELHKLLSDGCESPLYNRDVHESELRATLHYIRSALATSDHGRRDRALAPNHQTGNGDSQ